MAREAVTPASLASATPLLPAPCPRGSGSVSSNRSFQSTPALARGHVSARSPFGGSHHGSRGTSGAGRHPGRGKSTGCITSSPCLSFILTIVALINHRALVNACKTPCNARLYPPRDQARRGVRGIAFCQLLLAHWQEQPRGANSHGLKVKSKLVLRGSPGERCWGQSSPSGLPEGGRLPAAWLILPGKAAGVC